MSRNFTFFQSFGETAMKMTAKERLAFYDAIVRLAIFQEEPVNLPDRVNLVFTAIKPIIENSVRDTENGSKGGRPKKTTEETPSETPEKTPQKTPTQKPDENLMYSNVLYSNVKESKGVKGGNVADAPARPRFQKPSIEEVKKYVKNMGYYGFDVEHFYSYYESNGWKVGKNPMKDWTAAVRSWRSRDKAVSQDYISRTQLPDPSVYENMESTI